MTHIIYLSIIATLVFWIFFLEAQVRHWRSKWHSERSRRD